MKLNREATLANLITEQEKLAHIKPRSNYSRQDMEVYLSLQVRYYDLKICADAIKAGYPDAVILQELQFVGPGIAVQS